MKILQVNKYYYLRGGAETYMLGLSDWLTLNGHEVFQFAMKTEHDVETPFRKYFVSPIETSSPSLRGYKTLGRMLYSFEAKRNMKELLRDHQPDLCHLHNIYTQISPSILSVLKARGIPIVMTVHDHHLISPQYNIWADGCGKDHCASGLVMATLSKFHKDSHLASFAQTLTYKVHRQFGFYRRYVDQFICPSGYMRRQLILDGFDRTKIVVNPYGINSGSIEPRYDHDGFFLFVGRLSEEKGVEMIVRLAQELPYIQFKIMGRGPQQDYLHRLAIGTDNIEFLGFRTGKDLANWYQRACAVLVPSRVREVFPLVCMEAMSYGTPVIASNVGGIPEVVEDRVSGMLVDPMDEPGWIEAVLRLFHDTDLQSSMARNARARAQNDFRNEDHYRRLLHSYQAVSQKQTSP
jgi:glycosyltransferase involved in cell wall biosynthesis